MADSIACDEIVVALLEEREEERVAETENDFLLWVGEKAYSTPEQLESALRVLINKGAVLCHQIASEEGCQLTFKLAHDRAGHSSR